MASKHFKGLKPFFIHSDFVQERDNNAEDSDEDEAPEITQWEASAWLAILTLWISILSGYLVDAIQVNSAVSFFMFFFLLQLLFYQFKNELTT